MNLKRCPNGHYYDADEYAFCPKCEDQGVTPPAASPQESSQAEEDGAATVQIRPQIPAADVLPADIARVPQPGVPKKKGPVAGWLACIEGESYGCIYELKYGQNRIGDSPDVDILLTGAARADGCCRVVVTYDEENKAFTVNAGETRELSYINDQVILFDTKLHERDIIQTGGVRLMFVPLCGPDFSWESEE